MSRSGRARLQGGRAGASRRKVWSRGDGRVDAKVSQVGFKIMPQRMKASVLKRQKGGICVDDHRMRVFVVDVTNGTVHCSGEEGHLDDKDCFGGGTVVYEFAARNKHDRITARKREHRRLRVDENRNVHELKSWGKTT